jgi:hypothetical protein
MSFREEGNPTSHISKFLVQNVLFLTSRITWTSLIPNPMLVFFLDISPLAKLIEFITIEHFILKNPCMSSLRKLKMTKLMRL